MKRKLIYTLITFVVFITACKQYEHSQIEDTLISSYEELKGKTTIQNYDFTPNWSKRQSVNGGYYIPLSSDNNRFSKTSDSTIYSLADKTWLFAFKNDDKWEFKVLTVFPDDINEVKSGGVIVSEDLLTGKTSFVNYLNNKLVSRNDIVKIYASSNSKLAKERLKNCRMMWYQVCLDGTDICSSGWKEVCSDDIVDPSFPDFPPFPDGCDGCSSGGGGGGIGGGSNGDGGTKPPIDPNQDQEIIDSLQGYPCAQSILANIPNLENEISKWLNSVFSNNTAFNITFSDAPQFVGTKIDAEHSSFGSVGGQTHKIIINPDVLNKSSKEYIAATMFHEALHGFLNYERTRLITEGKGDQFGILYSGWTAVNVNGQQRFVNQHNSFGTQLDKLVQAIQSFNPNLSKYDALALAKNGIVNNLDAVESSVNSTHRDGKAGTKCD